MHPDVMIQKLKTVLQSVRYYLLCKNYRIILKSGLFDPKYYRGRIPGLQNSEKNPLIHYVDFGRYEGKSPSPFFDPAFYRENYSIVPLEDTFVHYLTVGMAAGHRPCAWFDPDFYQQQYLGSAKKSMSPLHHYQKSGRQKGLYPNRELFSLSKKPLLSIIVPVFNVSAFHLNNCIRSVVFQSYPHWELCLMDDCSSKRHVRPLLQQWATEDCRIMIGGLEENSGISEASNKAAGLAEGEYLGFLDNDDELAVECLARMVTAVNAEHADLYYTDEDLTGEDGSQFSIFHKPDFNSELLLCHNYITHFVLARTDLFRKVGGFDSSRDGAQDFDLLLKMTEQAEIIVHVPEVLYHWRASESSTSINHEQKSYANDAGRESVRAAMNRRQISADVEFTEWKFFYTVRKHLVERPLLSVLIVYRQDIDFRKWFSRLTGETSYPDVEYYILHDSSCKQTVLDELISDNVQLLSCDQQGSLSGKYNEAVKRCCGEYVVFLDCRIELQAAGWLEILLGHCMSPEIGATGGNVNRRRGKHLMTTVPDLQNGSSRYYARFIQECSRHLNGLQCTQDVNAFSWEFMMVERAIFLKLNGFDEKLSSDLFADIDLCFRMREAGYTLVYSPLATGEWTVSEDKLSCFSEETSLAKQQFQKKWRNFLVAGDPFYNRGVVKEAGIDLSAFRQWYTGEC